MQIGCQEKEKLSIIYISPGINDALSGPTQELVLTPTLQIGNSIKLDIRTATARCPFFGL